MQWNEAWRQFTLIILFITIYIRFESDSRLRKKIILFSADLHFKSSTNSTPESIFLIFQLRHAIQRSYSSSTAPTTKMFIDGKFVESKATEWIDLPDPATNEVITRVPKCTQSEMESAVESSKKAYKVWWIDLNVELEF